MIPNGGSLSSNGVNSTNASGKVTPNGFGGDGKGKGKGPKPPRKTNTPFQRVKPEDNKFLDERLKDNRFESRVSHSLSNS